MTNEEKILERLERIEEKITPIVESAASIKELKLELAPRVNEAVLYLIEELADIEADFQLEDLISLCKKALRNIKNINFSMDMLKNIIDFAITAEPLMKKTVPEIILFFDDLEQNNVFKILDLSLQTLKEIGRSYSEEELQEIANGLVRLTGLLKNLTRSEALELFEKASTLPAVIDLSASKPAGPFSILWAMGDDRIKQGLGVLLELTKGLSTLKNQE